MQDVAIRHTVASILFRNDVMQGLKILERNHRKVGPFRFGFESGSKLPFTGVVQRRYEPSFAFLGGLTPFVFLHDL